MHIKYENSNKNYKEYQQFIGNCTHLMGILNFVKDFKKNKKNGFIFYYDNYEHINLIRGINLLIDKEHIYIYSDDDYNRINKEFNKCKKYLDSLRLIDSLDKNLLFKLNFIKKRIFSMSEEIKNKLTIKLIEEKDNNVRLKNEEKYFYIDEKYKNSREKEKDYIEQIKNDLALIDHKDLGEKYEKDLALINKHYEDLILKEKQFRVNEYINEYIEDITKTQKSIEYNLDRLDELKEENNNELKEEEIINITMTIISESDKCTLI